MISFILVFAVLLGVSCVADTKPGSETFKGIASNCNAFHTVKKGDNCDTIVSQYDIAHAEFLEWNPALSKDCNKSIWGTYSYCVGVDKGASSIRSVQTSTFSTFTTKTSSRVTSTSTSRGQNTTTTRTFTTKTLTKSTSTEAGTAYSIRKPIPTWEVSNPIQHVVWPPQQTQDGQPSDCYDWLRVERGDTCESIASNYGPWRMSVKDFKQWNPAVRDDCSGLLVGWWVCIGAPKTHATIRIFGFHRPSTTVSIPDYTPKPSPTIDFSWPPSPTHKGASKSCKTWHQAKEGDTCDLIINPRFISKDDFYRANPGVESQCGGLKKGYYYCVTAHMPWEKEFPMPPTVTVEPTAVPSGQIKQCKAWYKPDPHEDCDLIVLMFYMFSLEDFVKWNPSVGKDCSKGIVDDAWYCVGVPGSPVTRTGIMPSPTPVPEEPTQKTGTCASITAMFTSWRNSITFSSERKTTVQTSPLYTASSERLKSSELGVTFITKTKSSVRTSYGTPMSESSETSTTDRSPPESTISFTNLQMQWTTSTVYTSRVLEVETSDYPGGPHFITETIPMSATLCPVSEVGTNSQHTQPATSISNPSTDVHPPMPNPTSDLTSFPSAPTGQHPDPTEATASARPSAVVSDGLGCPAPVATPFPREDCMVGGCKRFYLVQEGDYCTKISKSAGISLEPGDSHLLCIPGADLVKMGNGAAGSSRMESNTHPKPAHFEARAKDAQLREALLKNLTPIIQRMPFLRAVA
ncbi:hypothetical protein CEP54_003931 [Fusarium duplospermum]|uniref:LysM domain-containing protein n=1 Tax=Fusarium duplospermum TaxID=1325734 RepID=A0A428QLC7_9HYPO|nr:hypothetical protein CEP54_003931 [Fusarium duplospermum]